MPQTDPREAGIIFPVEVGLETLSFTLTEGYRDRVTGKMRSMLGRIRELLLGVGKSTSPRIARARW